MIGLESKITENFTIDKISSSSDLRTIKENLKTLRNIKQINLEESLRDLLDKSCKKGNFLAAKELIIKEKIIPNSNSLNYAMTSGNLELFDYIFRGLNKPTVSIRAFNTCCLEGHLELIRYYLDNKPDKNNIDTGGIAKAIEGGHLQLVKYLYEIGHGDNIYFDTIFSVASEYDRYDIMDYLIDIYRNKTLTEEEFEIINELLKPHQKSILKKLMLDPNKESSSNNNDTLGL